MVHFNFIVYIQKHCVSVPLAHDGNVPRSKTATPIVLRAKVTIAMQRMFMNNPVSTCGMGMRPNRNTLE